MGLVITNGMYYISTDKHGKIIKTPSIEEAQQFYNVNVAMRKIRKTPGKCKGYYVFDTDGDDKPSTGKKIKRKNYSLQERKMIYARNNGKCALCGRNLNFEDMTLDHIVPLSRGGEDNLDNIQPTCKADNQFKANILPEDFTERITAIFMYQMEKKYSGKTWWKIVHKVLENLI